MVARTTRRQTASHHRQTRREINQTFSVQDYEDLRNLGFTNKQINHLERTDINKDELANNIRHEFVDNDALTPEQMMRIIFTSYNPTRNPRIRIGGSNKRRLTHSSRKRRRKTLKKKGRKH